MEIGNDLSRSRAIKAGPQPGPLVLKVLAIAAIVAFGWFAFTLGDKDGTGRPNIVAEPMATAPQAE